MKNNLAKDLLVLGVSLVALICAAVALNDSLKSLANSDQQ